MRLIALYGVLAVVLGPLQCERRNPGVCDRGDFSDCESGYYCQIAATDSVGKCVPSECTTTSNTCPTDKPFCSEGRCVTPCSSDAQCIAKNPKLGVCISGSCVACRDNSTCTDAADPVCETTTHACRPCTLHGECASGVCAKDNTFATLPTPILQGSCVPSDRVQVVSDDVGCGAGCSLPVKMSMASVDKPYVLIKQTGDEKKIVVSTLPSGLPEIYIVGPLADRGPAVAGTTKPKSLLSNGAGSALKVASGAAVTIEGVVISDSTMYGVECESDKAGVPVPTKVRVLRSLIGNSSVGINAKPKCEIIVDQSWIGRGPSPDFDGVVQLGNIKAMQLDSTRLDMSSSVLWKNLKNGSFGGVEFKDSAALKLPSRIVHTTFISHDFTDARKVFAVDCPVGLGTVSMVNNVFFNSAAPTTGFTYVNANCTVNAAFAGNISNETSLGNATNFKDAVDTMFVASASGNFRLRSDAPASARSQGVLSASDPAGTIPLPIVDLDGLPRGTNTRSIGAFEAR